MTSPTGDPEANRPQRAQPLSVYQAAVSRPHQQAFSHVEEAAQVMSLTGTVLSNIATLSGIAKNTQSDLATSGAAISLAADSAKLIDIMARWRELTQSPRHMVHAGAVAANAAGQALKIYADRRAAQEGDNATETTRNYQISAAALTMVSAIVMAASKPSEAHARLAEPAARPAAAVQPAPQLRR
jgi:hypothetical protein